MSASTALSLNQLIEFEEPDGPTIHRIIHVDYEARKVVLFEVNSKKSLPNWVDFDELERRFLDQKARALNNDVLQPPFLPDDQLTLAARRARDCRLKVILPLVSPQADPSMPILRDAQRGQMIAETVARYGTAKDKIYRWLRAWWRHGQLENGLLPNFKNCGRGSYAKPGAKRGRKLSPLSKSHDGHVGANVDARTRKLIIRGARLFWSAKRGGTERTKRDAYQLTLQTFFYKRLEMRNGVLTPIVREGIDDDNRLPTFGQWNYHVEQHLKKQGALEARYNERELALKRRAVLGSSEHLSRGPGDLYLIDATVADVYLLSSYDKRWVIGRPVLYLVVDHFSRMVAGMHVAFEGPNWTGAMMALANAFTDKVAFCVQHGVEITHADWPCDVAPNRLTADRGEVISEHADYIVPGFRMAVQNTPPFRAEFKSFVEGQFKITNETGIKRMPGWVDKLKDRGGPDYRLDATLDLKAFTQLIIKLILHNNRTRGITSNVPLGFPLGEWDNPVPLELWDWGLANASPSVRRFAIEDVHRNLLPTYDAIHTRYGLSVMGGRLHYTTPRAISESWFVKAPTRGGRTEKLAIDPWDVSVAFLRRPNGDLEQCELTPADVHRFAGRTLADAEDLLDRDKKREKGKERRRIQDDADLKAQIDGIKDLAAEGRRVALAAADRSKPDVSAMMPMRNFERDMQRLGNASSRQANHDPEVPSLGASPSKSRLASIGKCDDDDSDHIFMPD